MEKPERRVVSMPALEQKLLLRKGDTLHLTPAVTAWASRRFVDAHDCVMMPASIGITLPEAFRDVQGRRGRVV